MMNLTKNTREELIIDFIRTKKETTRSEITRYTENKFATKKTVDRIVKDLLTNGTILEKPVRPNSRNKLLIINNENELGNLRYELSEIKNLFSAFLEKLNKIYSQPYTQWPYHPTVEMSMANVNHMIHSLLTIPVTIVNMISNIFAYRRIKIWMKYDDDLFKKLNESTFTVMNEITFSALKTYRNLLKPEYRYDPLVIVDPELEVIHNSYDKYDIDEKIPILGHRCKSIGLLQEYKAIINYLILKNTDYFENTCPAIRSDFKFNFNPECKNMEKIDIIHEFYCPAKKENKCQFLDTDPVYPFF